MGKRYFCDYCDRSFQDNLHNRKKHLNGLQHLKAKKLWYDMFRGEYCRPGGPAGKPWSPVALIVHGEALWASDHPGLGSLKSQRERPGPLAPEADGPSEGHVAGAFLSPQS